jgi:hypothetical protein
MSTISLGISSTTNVVTLVLDPQNTLSISTAGSVTPTSILGLTDVNASSITDSQVLVFDASTQTFIPASNGASSDTNIGNTDQTLTGVRDVEMAGNNLTFSQGDTVVHKLTPASGVTFNNRIDVSGTSTSSARITLREDTDNGVNGVTLAAPSATTGVTFTLPSADGSDGHFLKTDAAGNLSFAADNNDNTQLTDEQVQDIVGAMLTGNTETRISVTYDDTDGTIDFAVDDMTANTQLTDEQVQDIVGAMFSGNTETLITATYQDADGTIDLVVPDMRSPARSLTVACSDETTALTTGTKATFRMPEAATITAVRASVKTAPAGSALTVDINEDSGSGSASILSTKLTIDAGEKTSTTAATPVVISDTSIADDAEMTIDIDTIGSSTAGAGLKVTIYYTPT